MKKDLDHDDSVLFRKAFKRTMEIHKKPWIIRVLFYRNELKYLSEIMEELCSR